MCGRRIGTANGFATHRLGDECTTGHEKAEAFFVCGIEFDSHVFHATEIDEQGRIGSFIAQVDAALQFDSGSRHALRFNFVRCDQTERREFRFEVRNIVLGEQQLDRLLAHGHNIGKPHAVCRKHARERVYVDARHAELIRHQTGVLSTGTAEAGKRICRHVVAALHRNKFDGVCHVGDGDTNKSFGDFCSGLFTAGCSIDFFCEHLEHCPHDVGIEWLIAAWPEHAWKMIRLDFP